MNTTPVILRVIGGKAYRQVEIENNHSGRFLVAVSNTRGRSDYYSFGSEGERDRWLDRIEAAEAAKVERRKAKKAEKAQARAAIINPYKVGDIFTESWGYDQTNVDAYQVVAVGAKSVKLRRIGLTVVETLGWASEKVAPKKDNFVGEETITKILQPYGTNDPYVPSVCGHGWMSLYTGGSQYASHYA